MRANKNLHQRTARYRRVSCILSTVLMLPGVLAGCGLPTPPSISNKFDSSVNGTKVLVSVIKAHKRTEILDPPSEDKIFTSGWREKLLEAGYSDSDIVDDSEIETMSTCYAANSGVNICRNKGLYLAHVPPNYQGQIVPRVRQNMFASAQGDIVEIELQTTPSGWLIAVVTGIRRRYDEWKDCRLDRLVPSVLERISPLGPPQGASLTCDGLESEGWSKVTSITGIYEWRKRPSRGPLSP